MKDQLTNDWVEVLKTKDSTPEATITGLKEKQTVQFRVRAINMGGPGAPSDATEPHVVKHKNQKPYIDRTNLKNLTIKAGRSHKYEVDVRGEPPPTITWTFGETDTKVSDNNNIKLIIRTTTQTSLY